MDSDQKRIFITIALSAVVLIVWQVYFMPSAPAPTPEANIANQSKQVDGAAPITIQDEATKILDIEKTDANYKTFKISQGGLEYTVTNDLALINVKNEEIGVIYQDIVGEDSEFGLEILTSKGYKKIQFDYFLQNYPHELVAKNSFYGIKATLTISDQGRLNLAAVSKDPYKYRYYVKSSKKEAKGRKIREFVYLGEDVEREQVGSDDKGEDGFKWLGVDFRYHLMAFVFEQKQVSNYQINEDGTFYVSLSQSTSTLNGSYIFVKKDYDKLKLLGDKLHLSVDFGLLAVIAVPLLKGLKFIYKYFPNYGVAIIILTFLIRLVMYPLQHKSFKSMKKMQKVQPELKKLKTKFKDDPQRMQKETMALFKREGANPLGGCLPMLLQMPIFFAMYKVLYSAVELVDAPFIFWITDLSEKDIYYVLPIIMTLSMLAQFKFMPSTSSDPNQKKMMMIMPFVMGFIMKDLPAGLCLYWSVSTFLSIGQQFMVNKFSD